MAKVFVRKEMPYLFLLLVAVLGFLVVKFYDRASSLRILECTVERQSTVDHYVIKNLSRTSKVQQARIWFIDKNATVAGISVEYVPPAIEPEAPEPPKQASPSRWYLVLGDLGPTRSVKVAVLHNVSHDLPTIRFASDSDVVFMNRSWFTALYDNEFTILAGLIVLALILTIIYTVLLSRKRDEAKT